ncbi:MAG: 50S ribosomal protein L18e [Candidatus Aenigmatarchaeota archaeon]
MEKTNPVLKKTVSRLEEKGRKEELDLWKDLAKRLKKPRRNKSSVNISKINRHAKEGETVVVPGKVTGYGSLDKDVDVAAFDFSKSAKEKVEEGGKVMSILDLAEENQEGENVRIMEG